MSSDDARYRSVGRGDRTRRGSHSPVQEYETPDRTTTQLEHIKMANIKEIFEEYDEGTVLERTLTGRAFHVKKLEVSVCLWARQIFQGRNIEKAMSFFTDAFHESKDLAKRAGIQDPKKAWSNLEGSITRHAKNTVDPNMATFNFMNNFMKADLRITMFEPLLEHAQKLDSDAEAHVPSIYSDMKSLPQDLVLGAKPKRVRRKKDVTLSSITGSESESSSDSDSSDDSDQDDSDGDDKNVRRKQKGRGIKRNQGKESKSIRGRQMGTRRSARLAEKARTKKNQANIPNLDHQDNGVAMDEERVDVSRSPVPSFQPPARSPSRHSRAADDSREIRDVVDSHVAAVSPIQLGPVSDGHIAASDNEHDLPPQTQLDDWMVHLHEHYEEMFDTEPPQLPTPSSSEYSDWCGNPPAENYTQFPQDHPVGPGFATLSSLHFSDLHQSAYEDGVSNGGLEGNDTDRGLDATLVNEPTAEETNTCDPNGDDEGLELGDDCGTLATRLALRNIEAQRNVKGARRMPRTSPSVIVPRPKEKRSLATSPLDDLFHEPQHPLKQRCRAPSTDMGLDEEHVEKSRSTRSDNDMESLNGLETDVQLEAVNDKKKKKKSIWGRVKSLFKRKKAHVPTVVPMARGAPVEEVVSESAVNRTLKRRLSVEAVEESEVSTCKKSRDENAESDESPLPSGFDMTIIRGHFHGHAGFFSDITNPQLELPAQSTPAPSEAAYSTTSEDDAPRTIVNDVTITDSLEESLDLVHGVVDVIEHLINTVVSEAEGPQSQPSDSVLEFTRYVGQLLRVEMDLDATDPFAFIGDGRASELPKEK